MGEQAFTSPRKAVTVGLLSVTLPALVIDAMAAGLFLLARSSLWRVFAAALVLFSWVWWSIVTPRWRSWALRSGVDPDALYRSARRAGLVSRKASAFEKTEIYLSDHTYYRLLGGLVVSVFLTIETLASNYLRGVVPLPDPFGSILAAAIAAATLYPVHNALGRLLKPGEDKPTRLLQ